MSAGEALQREWMFSAGDVVKHRKGGVYIIVAHAWRDNGPVPPVPTYVYRSRVDRKTWARDAVEFEDGRFTVTEYEALRASPQPSEPAAPVAAESEAEIAERVVAIVAPLLDEGGTFGSPDWAIQVAHAAMYWNDPARKLARTAHPEPAAAEPVASTYEVGWLIENNHSGGILYRTIRDELPAWTADVNEAIRFARRVDAEMFCAGDEDAWHVVEHAWGFRPPSASAPPQPSIAIQEAWEAGGGNPSIKPSKAELLENLRLLDEACDEADAQPSEGPARVTDAMVEAGVMARLRVNSDAHDGYCIDTMFIINRELLMKEMRAALEAALAAAGGKVTDADLVIGLQLALCQMDIDKDDLDTARKHAALIADRRAAAEGK